MEQLASSPISVALHPPLFNVLSSRLLSCIVQYSLQCCCFCSRCRRCRCCCYCCSCCSPSTLGYFRSLQLTSRRRRRCRSLLTFAWRTPSKVGRETERGERTLRPLSWQRSRRRTSTFCHALEWLQWLWKGGGRGRWTGGRYKSYRDHINMLKSFECIHTLILTHSLCELLLLLEQPKNRNFHHVFPLCVLHFMQFCCLVSCQLHAKWSKEKERGRDAKAAQRRRDASKAKRALSVKLSQQQRRSASLAYAAHTHARTLIETVTRTDIVTLSHTQTDYHLLTHTCIQWDQHLLSHTHTYARMHICIERKREMSPKKPSPTWATCMRALVCVCLRVCLHCFYLIYVYCIIVVVAVCWNS